MFFITGFLMVRGQDAMPFSCGTEYLEEIKQQMLINRELFKGYSFQRGAINYVPVKVFLVALNDGSSAPSVINTLRMMCQLNKAYEDQEIQFYIKEIKLLNNTTVSTSPKSSGGALQLQLNKDIRAINIYIVNSIEEGVAGFYLPTAASNNDYIVIDRSYMADVRAAPHEVGHYFSLPHTFHGWDFDPWNPAIHGNPVNRIAPNGITINEFADSSNCGPKNVGDGFCDTPADYNFASNICNYTLNAQDPNGKLVNPMTNNFMNYFFGCSKYIFTPQQKIAIQTSFISNGRKDIRGTSPVSSTVITTVTKLLSPANGSPTVSADSVSLDWEDVPGATNYLVQYDVVPTFELLVQSIVTKESKLTINKLTQNRTYYWRVIPYNDFSTCFLDPTKFTFKAGALTAVNDIPEVKSFAVFPNPVIGNKLISLQVESRTGFSGVLSLHDLSGKKLFYQSNEKFPGGITSKSLDVSSLSSGVYILSIATSKGIGSRKLIIY
ncbi:MAG: T9SS type A sorting domain-containing protein [Saprospiraceae bacterium]